MSCVVVCLIAAVRYKDGRFFEPGPVIQLRKCPRFVFLSAVLYDSVQIELIFQVIQSVQMQQVVSASIFGAVKVGHLVVNVAWNLHMGTIHCQQCVPVPPSYGTVFGSKPAQDLFKGSRKEPSPLLNEGRCSCGCWIIVKLPLQFHIQTLSAHGKNHPAQCFKGQFAAACEIPFGIGCICR